MMGKGIGLAKGGGSLLIMYNGKSSVLVDTRDVHKTSIVAKEIDTNRCIIATEFHWFGDRVRLEAIVDLKEYDVRVDDVVREMLRFIAYNKHKNVVYEYSSIIKFAVNLAIRR